MQNSTKIRSILRSVVQKDCLNILVLGVAHERYETTLAQTGHNFYCLDQWKKWNTEYGEIPKNYNFLKYIPYDLEFDLILCHVSDQRLEIAVELGDSLNIPVIRQTHTLPETEREIQIHQSYRDQVSYTVFISKFSMERWGYSEEMNAGYIDHSLDSFWFDHSESFPERKRRCLSVVNYWEDRDWACGWTLWNEIKNSVPTLVIGDNPGLSVPLPPKKLKPIYESSLVFLNTSLNSPIPMSLLEAMACGCAVVSTPNCMVSEIIEHGVNGFLGTTPEELINYCNLLLSNPENAVELGKKARQTVENRFNLSNFKDNWDKTFKGVFV